MLIGIMSDSHGRAERVRAAFQVFDGCGVEHIFHCGDVGGVDVFDEFVGRSVSFVWGNCDMPDGGMLAYLRTVGLEIPEDVPLICEMGGKRFAVLHGHEMSIAMVVESSGADYVLHGHTHEIRDERLGDVRVINPGALHRAATYTVATLETLTDEMTYHVIG